MLAKMASVDFNQMKDEAAWGRFAKFDYENRNPLRNTDTRKTLLRAFNSVLRAVFHSALTL
jgi:hypothetical protein